MLRSDDAGAAEFLSLMTALLKHGRRTTCPATMAPPMAAPDRVEAVLTRVRDVAPPGFFERNAADVISRLSDRARGALTYLAPEVEERTLREVLTGDRLALLADDALDELAKSLATLAARDADRHSAGIRSVVFRPKVQTSNHAPPGGRQDVAAWLERVGAAHLAGERAKPFVRETLDPRVLIRMPLDLTVQDALGAGWGEGQLPSWVLMPVRDAVAKSVADRASGMEIRDEDSWEEVPLSPVLALVSEVLRRERKRLGKEPLRSLPFRVQLDPGELSMVLTYDHAGRGATLYLGEAHLGAASFDPGSEDSTRRRLIEVALDAVHETTHPLHRPLRTVLEEPAWERTLRRLATFVRAQKDRTTEPLDRMAFRVTREETLEITPLRQKLLSTGGWSRGARELGAIGELTPESQEHYARFSRAARSATTSSGAMFRALVGTPAVVDAAGEPIVVRAGRARVVATDDPSGISLAVRVGTAAPLTFPNFLRDVFDGERFAVAYDEERRTIDVAEVPTQLIRLARTLAAGAALVPRTELPRLEPILFGLAEQIPLEWPTSLRGEGVDPDRRMHLYLTARPIGGEARLRFRPLPEAPDVVPGEGDALVVALRLDPVQPSSDDTETPPERSGRRVSTVRDRDEESESARRWAKRMGLDVHAADGAFSYVILEDEQFLDLVLRARDAGEDLAVAWRSEGRRTVRGTLTSKNATVMVRAAASWLSVDGMIEIDGQRLALAEVLAALRERRRYVRLADGSFAAIETDLRERLSALARAGRAQPDGTIQLSPALSHLVAALEDGGLALEADEAWIRLRARTLELQTKKIELPDGLVGTLREYQTEGFRWLVRLGALGVGACLADDMGLGKTIQALALLLERAATGPALVIAPTSVGPNWVAEAERFAPSLRFVLYRGRERRQELENLGPGVVLVTSYDIATLDITQLAPVEWATLVLDEAQMLKNASTQRGRAVRRLRSESKVALTGTPLENHLGELWSLFDVISPGLLGPEEEFRERFQRPIELDGDAEAHAVLRAIVKPFILRRRKAEVAPELPARTEVLQPVELSDAERSLYEAERAAAIQAMMGGEDGERTDAIRMLAVISRLRQLACHPKLVHPESSATSSKLTALLSVLDDVERAGGRALVFSEWTRLLAYVRSALEARRVPYLYLDGETPALERASRVARFQAGEGKVFLLSLRAGGTGLNLTGADWVIHLDPWWNPAVEDQATDRAHRIGQTKPVTVVRIVAQGTIEEAVMGLHAHKRALASGVLEGTEAAGKLGATELMDLIRGVDLGAGDLRRSKARRARAAE